MKIKLFVAREIQYFELGIFSFNSYVHYLTRGFIASTCAFNLPTCAFNLATHASNLAICAFNLATHAFSLLTCEFELITRGSELVTHEFELITHNLCFNFPHKHYLIDIKKNTKLNDKNGVTNMSYICQQKFSKKSSSIIYLFFG